MGNNGHNITCSLAAVTRMLQQHQYSRIHQYSDSVMINISGVSGKQVPIQGFQIHQLQFGDSKNEILDITPHKSSPVKQESNKTLIQRHGQIVQPKKSHNQAVNSSQQIGETRNMSAQKQERIYKQLKQKNQQFKRLIDALKKRESQLTKELQMYKKATPQGNCSQSSEVTPNTNQQTVNDQNIAQTMTTPSPPQFSVDQLKLAQIKKQLDQKEGKLEKFKINQVMKEGVLINEATNDSMNVQGSQKSSQLISIAHQIKKGKSIIEKLKEKQTKYQKIVKQTEQRICELNQKFNEKQNDILTINLQFEGLAEKSEKIRQIAEQLKRLEAQICQKNKERQNIDQALFEAKRNQQKTLKAILQQESADLKRIRDQTKQAKLEQERIMKDNMSKENAELEKIKEQSKKQKEDSEKLKQKTKEYTKKKDELEKQIRAKTTQFNSIIDKLRLVEADLERLSKQRDEIAALKNSISQKYQQKQRIDSELRQLTLKISNLQREEQNRSANIRQIREQIIQLQKQKKQYEQIKTNIEQAQRQHKQWLQVEALTQVYENTEKQKQQVQQDITNNNQQVTRTQKIKQMLIRGENQSEKQEIEQQIFQIRASNTKHRNTISSVLLTIEQGAFLSNEIVGLHQKQFQATMLLFKFPLMKIFKLHDEVDEKPNYLVVVALKNGMKIAMYAEMALNPNYLIEKRGKAFIASITNKMAFKLKSKNDCVTVYDQNQLIFGTGNDLKLWIKGNSSKIKVGRQTESSSFDREACKEASIFVGKDDVEEGKWAQVQDFEIHQIIFSEQRVEE